MIQYKLNQCERSSVYVHDNYIYIERKLGKKHYSIGLVRNATIDVLIGALQLSFLKMLSYTNATILEQNLSCGTND